MAYSTKVKRKMTKRQTKVDKILHRKLRIEQNRIICKTNVSKT
jgi:hypothetical protein